MLRWRLASAGVILCLVLGLAGMDYQFALCGLLMIPLLLLVNVMGTEEMLSLLASKQLTPVRWPVYFGSLLVTLAFALRVPLALWPSDTIFGLPAEDYTRSAPNMALAIAVMAVLMAEMWRFAGPGQHVVHIALAVFTIVYVGTLGGFLIALRTLHSDNAIGMTALASMIVVVKMADTGAYGFGRILGRTKLTPKLSPGKTVEGAIGGLVVACAASWAFFHFIAPRLLPESYAQPPLLNTLAYGVVLTLAAMIGDLAESLVKRDMGRKDSSTWLPGLGGVLDIMDSLLVGAPAAYLCWRLGLI